MFIITVSLIHFFPLIPFPYYCGCSFYWISGVDNGNIGFPWLILILLPFIYWIAEIEPNTITGVSLLFILLFVVLFLCFPLISFSLFFVVYECFITPLSFILFLFLPSSHRIRTAFISSLFTTFGSISLILSLLILILSDRRISLLCSIHFTLYSIICPLFHFSHDNPLKRGIRIALRAKVNDSSITGLRVVDSILPVGRGQRQLMPFSLLSSFLNQLNYLYRVDY